MENYHVKSLDGVRGWAAIAVIFYHGLLHYDLASIERVLYRSFFFIHGFWDTALKVLLVVFNGESAVLLFFVLSGFVLRRSLERSDSTVQWRSAVGFIIKRIFRLFPAVIVSVFGFRLLGSLCHRLGITSFPIVSWEAVIKNALLWDPLVIGPSWSIQTEFAATAIILLAFYARRWFGPAGLIFMFFYTCFAIDFPRLVGGVAQLWPYSLAFIVGMIMAEPVVIDGLRRFTGPRSQIVWLVCFVAGRHFVERAGVSGLIAQTMLAGLFIGSLVAHRSTALTRQLSTPFSQFLGRISYSLYLVNVLWLYLLWAILPVPSPGNTSKVILVGLISAFAALLLAIPFSYLSYRWVELPFNMIGRWIASLLERQNASNPGTAKTDKQFSADLHPRVRADQGSP